jgi:hypothetical protein
MNSEPDRMEPWALTAAGDSRREEIRILSERALSLRVRRRRTLRAGAAGASALLLILAAFRAFPARPQTAPPAPQVADNGPQVIDGPLPLVHSTSAESPPALTRLTVEHLGDDPGVLNRLRAAAPPSQTLPIDDDELLELLAQSGRPDGLIRLRGRVMLSSHLHGPAPQPDGSG